jgi:hypothetical protein
VRFDRRCVALDIRRCTGEPAAASLDNKSKWRSAQKAPAYDTGEPTPPV